MLCCRFQDSQLLFCCLHAISVMSSCLVHHPLLDDIEAVLDHNMAHAKEA